MFVLSKAFVTRFRSEKFRFLLKVGLISTLALGWAATATVSLSAKLVECEPSHRCCQESSSVQPSEIPGAEKDLGEHEQNVLRALGAHEQ